MTKFNMGDRVKQIKRSHPYGQLRGGTHMGDHVGVVVEVQDGVSYPYWVRMEGVTSAILGADLWPFREDEIEPAPDAFPARLARIVDEVDLAENEVEDTRSLYEKVDELKPGTIFIVGGGDPWIRTNVGVEATHSVRNGYIWLREIPEGWKTYEVTTVTILWDPVA